jgi:hypothetical protein
MVKEIILLSAILLTGCSTTVPIVAKFPEAPQSFKTPCPNLKKLKESDNISEIAKTVSENYTAYYECAVKHDAWIEWYEIQKKIYEGIK